ncbi:MAG TPA: fatty acid--CoA ligase, partial [Acidimicrobiales bacterium]
DDDGSVLPHDGVAVGHLEARGPCVASSYYKQDAPPSHEWLSTGDVARIHADGTIEIVDRSKDVIKSGGEWISSVELEGALMAHPAVFEAAVIAVPDERWQERPLSCVVLRPDATASAEELRDFLATKVAKWWLPERWAFIETVPKTSVGKFDKKVLRAQYAENELPYVTLA